MLQLDKIVRYKESLGYSTDADKVLLAQSDAQKSILTGWMINNLVNSWYYISFEQAGLLFMKTTATFKPAGENQLIPINTIQRLAFTPVKLSAGFTTGKTGFSAIELEIVDTSGQVMTMAVQKFYPGHAWVKQNLQTVRQMLGAS